MFGVMPQDGVKIPQHTLSVIVENRFGVLARVAGLFSGRGYNIESLTVNTTENAKFSRMTIVTSGDEQILDQIDKQLNKLVDVVSVTNLTGDAFVERELALIKVHCNANNRADIVQLTEIFQGKIVIVMKAELGIELSGSAGKIDDFIALMTEYGLIEVARSGRVAISRKPGKSDGTRENSDEA